MVGRAVVIGGLFAAVCAAAVVGLVGNSQFGDGLPVTVPPSAEARLDDPTTPGLATVSVPSEALPMLTISIVPAPTTMESTIGPSGPGDTQSGADENPPSTSDDRSAAAVTTPPPEADDDPGSGTSGADEVTASDEQEPGAGDRSNGGGNNGNGNGGNNGNGSGSDNGNGSGGNNGNGGGSNNGNGRGNGN